MYQIIIQESYAIESGQGITNDNYIISTDDCRLTINPNGNVVFARWTSKNLQPKKYLSRFNIYIVTCFNSFFNHQLLSSFISQKTLYIGHILQRSFVDTLKFIWKEQKNGLKINFLQRWAGGQIWYKISNTSHFQTRHLPDVNCGSERHQRNPWNLQW